MDGGPIALIEEGDLIEINVSERKLALIGVKGESKRPEEIDLILEERKANWQPKPRTYTRGVLSEFTAGAVSPMKGAYIEGT